MPRGPIKLKADPSKQFSSFGLVWLWEARPGYPLKSLSLIGQSSYRIELAYGTRLIQQLGNSVGAAFTKRKQKALHTSVFH